jgi:hypothetical protein
MNVVLPKLPVESVAPRQRSGPGLKEGGKAPPLPSSSLLPVSDRQEARCCRYAVDEAQCIAPPPSTQLHPPLFGRGVGGGDELGQLQRRRSPSYKEVLFCQSSVDHQKGSKEGWQVVKCKRSKLCTSP